MGNGQSGIMFFQIKSLNVFHQDLLFRTEKKRFFQKKRVGNKHTQKKSLCNILFQTHQWIDKKILCHFLRQGIFDYFY
jgi:hypothetical protein